FHRWANRAMDRIGKQVRPMVRQPRGHRVRPYGPWMRGVLRRDSVLYSHTDRDLVQSVRARFGMDQPRVGAAKEPPRALGRNSQFRTSTRSEYCAGVELALDSDRANLAVDR